MDYWRIINLTIKKTMGRKKLLKLQRREEREQEIFSKKVKKKKIIIGIVFLAVFIFAAYQVNIALKNLQEGSTVLQDNGANKIVVIETNKGNIKLELYTNDAPKTVENFVKLASENFYDGIKFHRVMPEFMIQGGDPLSKDDDPSDDGTGGPGYSFADEMNPISLGLDELTIQRYEESGYEYDYNLNSHKVEVGSLAMANSGPNTNGSQFFIVTEKAQPHLDGKHTVFGKVIEGMEVARSIKQGDVMNKVYVVESGE